MAAILIIEDSLEIRENSAEILELEGHTVFVAENGKRGLEMANKNLPDIVLCDILMPELNGYQVLAELKNSERTSQIPLVFITASTERKDIQIGLDLGASAYILKPFEMEELTTTIESCLSKAKL